MKTCISKTMKYAAAGLCALTFGGIAVPAAQAQGYYSRDYRGAPPARYNGRYRHDVYVRERYAYPQPVYRPYGYYSPPPVVYAPPRRSPGISLFFGF